MPSQGSLLHVGCGSELLPEWARGHFEEVRLDIDESHSPHIVANMKDLGDIGPFNAVFSCHSLEHLYPHEVPQALSEFRRVLAEGGYAVIIVPDLEDVQATEKALFQAFSGPITGLDLMYGARNLIENCPYMAHHCGFTQTTLHDALANAGFSRVSVKRQECYNLIAVAVK
jgi:ubiquinone/menaquinone biosynthesis C-methylase UbiE